MKTENIAVEPKLAALATYLECDAADLTLERHDHYGLAVYSIGSAEYAIGDDSQADEAAENYISDTLWAFRASFVLSFCKIRGERAEKAFEKMQSELCEDANEIVLAMIGDNVARFVSQAISADGRGHFLSGYDGDENEQDGFYIYRIN